MPDAPSDPGQEVEGRGTQGSGIRQQRLHRLSGGEGKEVQRVRRGQHAVGHAGLAGPGQLLRHVGDQAVDLVAVLDDAQDVEPALDLAPTRLIGLAEAPGIPVEVLVQEQRQSRRRRLPARRPFGEILELREVLRAAAAGKRLEVAAELVPDDGEAVGLRGAEMRLEGAQGVAHGGGLGRTHGSAERCGQIGHMA